MITYRTDPMNRVSRFLQEFAKVQSRLPEADYIALLGGQMDFGLRMTSAWHLGKCAGTFGYLPAASIHEGHDLARRLALPIVKCIVRANIYVHPHFGGRGLSRMLYRINTEDALAQGFEFGVGIQYQTDTIADWGKKLPGAVVTETTDSKGYPVIVSDLRKMLETISDTRVVAPRQKRPDSV